ncbi:hypothetical protein [Vibrio salilacus]|nr:hypothetical protein [Vibrio salilacus]
MHNWPPIPFDTISCGVALHQDVAKANTFRHADDALYQARR